MSEIVSKLRSSWAKLTSFSNQQQQGECLSSQVFVKRRLLHCWVQKQLFLNLDKKTLGVVNNEKKKRVHNLDQISYSRNMQNQSIILHIRKKRSYQIKGGTNLQQILTRIDYYNSFKKIGQKNYQLKTPIPKNINYGGVVQELLKLKNTNNTNQDYKQKESTQSTSFQKQTKLLQDYERSPYYINPEDWKKDSKTGGLILVNKDKKKILSELISYTAKKAVESGSLSNVNFPAFSMKSQSILQSYLKSLGAVPVILQKTQNNPLQRMKSFNVIILTFSILFNDIIKGFEPTLGQTLQGQIGGCSVYAQQIIAKPNSTTSFILYGKNYKLYASLQLTAQMSLNQVTGLFSGQITLQFDDGTKIKGIVPKGIMSGLIFGDIKFIPTGAAYSYDIKNKLVCSYQTKKLGILSGYIGKLNQSAQRKFQHSIKNKKDNNFSHLSERDFQTILSRIEAVYTDSISYDNKLYFSYTNNPENLPLRLQQNLSSNPEQKNIILPSDSSNRLDIYYKRADDLKESQKQNDRIMLEQQRDKKLRNKR